MDANKLKALWHQQQKWCIQAPQHPFALHCSMSSGWLDWRHQWPHCNAIHNFIPSWKMSTKSPYKYLGKRKKRSWFIVPNWNWGKIFLPCIIIIYHWQKPSWENILLHFIHALNLLRFPFQVASLQISWEVFIERFKLRYCPQSEGIRRKWRKTQRSAPNHSPPPLHSPNRNPTTPTQANCNSFETHSWMCLMKFISHSFTTLLLPQPLHSSNLNNRGIFLLVSKSSFCLLELKETLFPQYIFIVLLGKPVSFIPNT